MAGLRSLLAWWMGGGGKAEQKLEDQLSPNFDIMDASLSGSCVHQELYGVALSEGLSCTAADSSLVISYIEAI